MTNLSSLQVFSLHLLPHFSSSLNPTNFYNAYNEKQASSQCENQQEGWQRNHLLKACVSRLCFCHHLCLIKKIDEPVKRVGEGGNCKQYVPNLVRFAHNWNNGIVEDWVQEDFGLFFLYIIPLFHHSIIP
ncbi:MAG: hypothetical protein DRH10_03065 [Deltaproteobacteria bacterium]|nr:MAG: hypothetical protein DRH10_03065 [Deltaproteobacteria bacterium]RLC12650.1 MAG: hypothetical protein DRH43_00945 [Deltaproteobacteria bacterium]